MKKTVFTLINLCIGTIVFAQNYSITDTVHPIKEVEVVAFGTRPTEIGKLDVPLQYLPLSVSDVSSKTWEIRGITNIEEAVKFLPGVRMQTSYGGFQTLYVRGFSQTPIMVDGIRDERTVINSFPFPDLSDIESMELLKGPSSVLYGHSVLGGVLNMVRKSPTPQTVVNARMSYGSWENRQASLDFGGKLAGPVNYRANVHYGDQDGWRHNGNERFSGYFALGATIDATSKIDVRGGFHRDWYGTEIGLPPNMTYDIYKADGTLYLKEGEMQPGLNKKARYNNESDFFKNRGWNVSAKYEKKWGETMKLTNHLSYTHDDINYFGTKELSYPESNQPIYPYYYLEGDKKQYICLDTVQLTFPLRFSHIANTLTNLLELSGILETGEIKHHYMGGYSFTQMFRNSYTGYNLAPENDPTNSHYKVYGPGLYSKVSVQNPHSMGYMVSNFGKAIITKDYTHGIYLQDLIEFSEKLKVLLAGRYDHYKYLRSGADTYDGVRKYHKSEQTSYSIANNSAFTYRAGIVYLPRPELSVYASASSYYRPNRTFASANTIYLDKNGSEFTPNEGEGAFDPEQGFQMEIGSRYTYRNVLQASASLFYARKNDVVRSFGRYKVGENTDGTSILKNITGQVGSESSKGFDLELELTPAPYANFNVGYAYTHVDTRKITPNKYVDTDTQGLILVPENTFYTYGQLSVPKGCLKNLAFVFTVSFMDKVNRSYSNNLTFPSYWLTDIGLSYPLKNGIGLSVMVNNLFGESYINQALSNQMVPGPPRNYMLSISYSLR